MIDLLTSILPIGLGFLAKLVAIKSKAADDNQKLMIQAMNANAVSTNSARDFSKGESKMASLNRRTIIWVMLFLICFLQLSPVLFDVPTVIEVVDKGLSLFGIIQITPDQTRFEQVHGVIKFEEIFSFLSLIISFYFGASLSQTR